jgi:hypothetical protein
MKIAITGAHRVGKTTLAEKLQEHLVDYELRMEPYHELAELGYEFSEQPTVSDFLEQLDYSITQISTSDRNVIFDRCPIDFLAYIQAIDGSGNIQSIFNKVESIISELDLLVFVPIEEPDLIPGDTSDFQELRENVNEIMADWIGDFGVDVIEVRGTLSNRLEQILSEVTRQTK